MGKKEGERRKRIESSRTRLHLLNIIYRRKIGWVYRRKMGRVYSEVEHIKVGGGLVDNKPKEIGTVGIRYPTKDCSTS